MALPVYQDASGRVLKLVGGKYVPFEEKPVTPARAKPEKPKSSKRTDKATTPEGPKAGGDSAPDKPE